jgi:hypothetical protein
MIGQGSAQPRTIGCHWHTSPRVVITSVDRDDLPDGGAFQFVRCSEAMLMPGAAAALAAALTYISRITVGKAGLTKDCVLKGTAFFGLGKRQFGFLI